MYCCFVQGKKYQEEIELMKAKLDLQEAKVDDSEEDVESYQMKKGITLTGKVNNEISYIIIIIEAEFQLLQLRSHEQKIEISTLTRKLKQKGSKIENIYVWF